MSINQKKPIHTVIAGVLIMLFAGFVYAWSILSAPIAAEFPQWSSARLSLTFTVCMTFFCLGGLAGGALLRRVSSRFNIRVAAVLFLAGFLLTARMHSPAALYLGYGVLCGTAAGFAYNAVMSAVPRWFPKQQGLVSGILLMGFGLGGMFIGAFYTELTPTDIGAWRGSLQLMGILMAVVLAVCSFFIRTPETAAPAEKAVSFGAELSPWRMLRSPGFWCFFLWATLLSAAGLAVIGQARPIALSVGPSLTAGEVSLIVGMISICNGLGRILVGALYDRFGQKVTMSVVVALFLAGAGVIAAASAFRSPPLLIGGYVALGMGYGGGPTTGASLTRDFFGSKHYSVNFSITNLNLMLASLGSTAAGVLYDASGSFTTTFALLFLCIVAAWSVMPGVRRPGVVPEIFSANHTK